MKACNDRALLCFLLLVISLPTKPTCPRCTSNVNGGMFILNKKTTGSVRVHMPVVIIVLTFKTSYINCLFCLNLAQHYLV